MNYLYSHNVRCANCNSLCFFITELTWVLNPSFLPKVENKPIQDNQHFSFKHSLFRIELLFCSLFPGVISVSGSREEAHLADAIMDSGVLASVPAAPVAHDLGPHCGFHLPGQCCWLSLCPSSKASLSLFQLPSGPHLHVSWGAWKCWPLSLWHTRMKRHSRLIWSRRHSLPAIAGLLLRHHIGKGHLASGSTLEGKQHSLQLCLEFSSALRSRIRVFILLLPAFYSLALRNSAVGLYVRRLLFETPVPSPLILLSAAGWGLPHFWTSARGGWLR